MSPVRRHLRFVVVSREHHVADLIEIWIDETERRQWFLAETVREP
jgi:DNA-binding ferritin-like protein